MKKTTLILILIVTSLSSVMASTVVVNKVFPGTVLIATEDKNGQYQSLGSGFLVSANVVATNFHVIENSYSGFVKFVNKDKMYEIGGVVGYSTEYDLALIQIGDNSGTPLALKSPTVDIGQKIFAIGSPLGLEGTISDGIISGLHDFEGYSLMQISAPISPGSSGGPVVDENGEVVGVATSTFEEGQNLNFAVPVKYLKELFDNQTSLASLSSLVKVNPSNNVQTSKDFKGVTITKLIVGDDCRQTYMSNCDIGFSIKNNLRQKINKIKILHIIYDSDGEVLDYGNKIYPYHSECLEAKMSKRYAYYHGAQGIGYLFTKKRIQNYSQDLLKYVELRILDFEICD